jgi:hypothetical protein
MVHRFRRATAAAAVTAVAALGLLPMTQASAATVRSAAPRTTVAKGHMVGVLYNWDHGIPARVKRGSTITLSFWYRQTSPEVMAVGGYGMGLWNSGDWTMKGLTVTWLDPLTRHWEKPTYVDSNHLPEFDLPQQASKVLVEPNAVSHIDVRVTFNSNARLGAWRAVGGISWYSLLGRNGQPTNDWLQPAFEPTTTFTLTR